MIKLVQQTVCYIYRNGKILLGLKKARKHRNGLGIGKWNGYGGDIENGETVEEAVVREVREKSGLSLIEAEEVGTLEIYNEANDFVIELHVFLSTLYKGIILPETEEMVNRWFPIGEIPYKEMWPSDEILLPRFFEGKKVIGNFCYDSENRLISHNIRNVPFLLNA